MENKIFKLKGKTLAIIDWANVYGWFEKLKWEIDPKKLYDYLKSYPEIQDIRFYFGLEKGNEKSEKFQEKIKNIGYNLKSKDVKWVPVSLEKSHFKELVSELFNVLDNVKTTNSEISKKLYELIETIDKMVNDSYGVTSTGEPTHILFSKEQLMGIYGLIELLDEELRKLNINIGNLQKNLSKPVLRRKCDFDCEITLDAMNNLEKFSGIILFSGDGDYAALVDELIKRKKQIIVVFAPGCKGKEFEDFKIGLYLCSVNKLKEFLRK